MREPIASLFVQRKGGVSSMRKKKLTTWQKIDRWIFGYQVRFLYWRLTTSNRIRRWLYCRKGYHKIRPQYLKVSVGGSGKKERCIFHGNWFECIYCNRLFFTTKKERDKYARYQEREKKENERLAKIHLDEYMKERYGQNKLD